MVISPPEDGRIQAAGPNIQPVSSTMTDHTLRPAAPPIPIATRLSSPCFILGAALVVCVVLLMIPLRMPMGAMIWDTYLYYDAANRIGTGQMPSVDFFTPVGPLGYYLFAGLNYVFPNASSQFIGHWALLLVSGPLIALIVHDVDKRSRGLAFALLIPFLIFALLPFNTGDFYPFPGSDGFGIYNRQITQMLYVLVAALFFMKDERLRAIVIGLSMVAMFFLKITGFVAGGVICFYALLTARVSIKHAIAIGAGFVATLGILEVTTGMTSRYVEDILTLVGMNSGTLVPRFLQSTSLNFSMFAASMAVIAVLAWHTLKTGFKTRKTGIAAISAWLDQDWLWLGVILFAGILFETQNTGSQALIFMWPILLYMLRRRMGLLARPAIYGSLAVLSLAVMAPPAMAVIQKAGRTYLGAIKNLPLAHTNLKSLGNVSMRPDVAERADIMGKFYPSHRALYEDLVPSRALPSPLLYSDYDFQILYLQKTDEAISRIHTWERDKGIRFETMMSINFANPIAYLMDRQATKYIAIGADPYRSVPPPQTEELDAVAATDLVVWPKCPPTATTQALYELYRSALVNHKKVALTECYDAFVHPKFADKFAAQ